MYSKVYSIYSRSVEQASSYAGKGTSRGPGAT
jgi:hypothetical protein